MSEPFWKAPPTTQPTGGRKSLALLGAGLFVIIVLYLSRSPLGPAPATAVADEKPSAATAHAVDAANAFLAALAPKQREKAAYDFGSAKKPNWSNLPVTMVPRNGVRLGDLTQAQRTLAMDVVAAVLSKGGFQKVLDIMGGDQQLANRGQGGRGGRAM